MKPYDVVLLSGAEHLRHRLLKHGVRVFTCELNYDGRRLFPNADIYVRLPEIAELSDRRVVVIQSCTGAGPAEREPFSTADRVVELFLLLDLLRQPVAVEKTGPKNYKTAPIPPPRRVEVVLTFQAFSLQDKAFLTGEIASARWVMNAITQACNKTWVVNPHAPDSLDWVKNLIDRGQYEVVDIIPDLVEFGAKQFGFDDFVCVTPDEGARERYEIAGFSKSRTNSFTVQLSGEVDVTGRNAIVIDDLTKSGSTLLKAAERLRNQGAKEVGAAVAHVLPLIEKGEELLKALVIKSNERIVTSNTVFTKAFCEQYPHLLYNVVDTLVKIL